LAPIYPQLQFAHCASSEQLIHAIADAEVYLGWLNRHEFLAAHALQWIQSPSSGVDHFLVIPELRQGNVLLTSARGTHGACLAEHALAMIFAFTRGIKTCVIQQQKRRWSIRELRPTMVELTRSTMGIIGFGAAGQALAKRASVFDVRILAVDVLPVEKPEYVERLDDLSGLDALLKESDYVVVTVPYTEETRGMLSADRLAQLKPSAILVGVSRGGIIDEEALAQALQNRRLAGAALDVFKTEPLPDDSPLWGIDNLLITPHVGGGSQFEGQTILEIFTENLGRFLRGEFPLRNQVDKTRGF
jgi:phosphoglycerate dehydrogenase-like enzyme